MNAGMPSKAVEYGTLWALDRGNGLPPVYQASVKTKFTEGTPSDIDDLARAMNLPSTESIQRRFEDNRRCFILKISDEVAAYGWVTLGAECVGEFNRQFNFNDDEAYIWDCGTVPTWRNKGCYSALLSHIIYRLHNDKVPCIWIGASRLNKPSVRGFANAGFKHVVNCTYRRLYRLTLLTIKESPDASPYLVSAAYRILVAEHEWRLGFLAFGYK